MECREGLARGRQLHKPVQCRTSPSPRPSILPESDVLVLPCPAAE